jgi:DNA-binding MarR family transcriptional regulator
MVRGYIRRAVLWHLMEEGVLGMAALEVQTGCLRQAVVQATASLRKLGLVAYVQPEPEGDHRVRTLALTPSGIEMALTIDRSDLENLKTDFKSERKELKNDN